MVAAGRKMLIFCITLLSTYYIYDEKFDSLEQATYSVQNKGSEAYKAKMSIVKSRINKIKKR
jgi:hypothetical protein